MLYKCTLRDCRDWMPSREAGKAGEGGCQGYSIWPLMGGGPEDDEPYTAEHRCCGYQPVYRSFLWPVKEGPHAAGISGPGDMPEWCEGRKQWDTLTDEQKKRMLAI